VLPTAGIAILGTENTDLTYTYTWEITGLSAQTPYQIFLFVEDLGKNTPDEQRNLSYQTKDRFNRATLQMKFLQEEILDFFYA
jgi:hypothetical protein